MSKKRLLPVVVLDNADWAEPLAEALLAGGLDQIEITLRTEAALEGIRRVAAKFPQMRLGAGTVLEPGVISQLKNIGVSFLVTPGINPVVIEAAHEAGLQIYPGITSPTEIETARALGCRSLKFFPAEPLGGVPMLKALIGPYGHTGIRFVPTGGITPESCGAYAKLPEVEAVGGSWFVKADLMKSGQWDKITELTREGLALVS